MALAVDCKNVGAEELRRCTLDALSLSSKALLHYDYSWKPTEQAIQKCCLPPKVSSELANVPPVPVIQGHGNSVCVLPSSANGGTISRKARLMEKELDVSYDDTHVCLFHYEEENQNKLHTKSLSRQAMFENISKESHKQKRQYLKKKKQEKVQISLKTAKAIQESDQKRSEEARLRQQKLRESHQESAARAVKKVHQVEEWQQRVLEEQRIQREVQQIESRFHAIESSAHSMQQSLEMCVHKSHLSSTVPSLVNKMKELLGLASNIVTNCKEHPEKATSVIVEMDKCYLIMKNLSSKAASAVHEATLQATKEQEELQSIKKAEEMKKQQAEQLEKKVQREGSDTERTNSEFSRDLLQSISESSFKEYSRLEKLLSDACKSYEPFVSDKSTPTKQFKLGLHKAVTTPINAISDQSSSHLLDKIKRLTKLLSGQPIEIPGKSITANSSPFGQVYCRELLAKKIVQQGSQQVSSSPESAFPIASVAIGVWSAFPDVGDLILAHLYKACPFLVPFYIPKTEGTSDAEYYSSLGYTCVEGEVEAHDKYLKRMSGLVRLYAAIISSPPPRGMSQDHPHGIAHGWYWLARLLNLQPRPDYTATALYHFLEVAGHALVRKYKKQFWKLLLVLVKEYLPRIEQVSSSAQSGPIVRLKGFLENCIKKQDIELPVGYLTPHWWNSRHGW